MRARYYNPEIKRFVNRDVLSGSIDDGLTINHYAYVNGNPISYIDPFGLSADGDSWVTTGLSYGADAVPILGAVKGFQETITGVNYITGEQLSVAERVADRISSLTGWIPISGAKHVGKYGTEGFIDAGGWVLKQFGTKESTKLVPRLEQPVAGDNVGSMLSKSSNDAYGGYYQRKKVRTDDYNNKNGAWTPAPKTAIPNSPYRTDKEAEAAAKLLGFEKVNGGRAKAAVFYSKDMGIYITRDIPRQSTGSTDNGGVWKMAPTVEDLMSRQTRLGTYDKHLNRIGD